MGILHTFRVIIGDVLLSMLYFPIWWYTEGAMKVIRHIGRELHSLIESLHLRTLFSFLLKPMYGQTDIWGRVISIGVRLVHFFLLFVLTTTYTLLLCAVLILWLVIPVFVLYSLAFHFGLAIVREYA